MNYLFSLILFILLAFQMNGNSEPWQEKVSESVLAEIDLNGTAEFFIVFREEANLAPASSLKGKNNKGEYVFITLKKIANRTQKNAVSILKRKGVDFTSFYLLNTIYTKGDEALLKEMALLSEVKAIYSNPSVKLTAVEAENSQISLREELEWGIKKINADDVWELGFKGQGIVVAGADTGVKWDIPTIENQYRGNMENGNILHDYNWHDAIHSINPLHNDSVALPQNNPCGLDVKVPCDDNNHGTHTVGTMIGSDTSSIQVGVAPAAKWIACRNMERGYGSPATYLECFEWFLAPTDAQGENPKPEKAPHVINNSWSCPEMEGCTPENWWMIEQAVNNLKAAGIVVVVSAGNSGPNCHTINTPAAIFEGSFTVGAINMLDTMAAFSSRGTVLVDTLSGVKPNVVAPGVGVLSCVRDSTFRRWSGTSMAGPHVAGAVALLLSAFPDLIGEVDMIEDILEATAIPVYAEMDCDSLSSAKAIPNSLAGYGRIDILAAFERARDVILHLDNTELPGIVKIYPNPSFGSIEVDAVLLHSDATLNLYSTDGRLVRIYKLNAYQKQTIQLSDIRAGLYFYQIDSKEYKQHGKLIKK